MCVVALAGLGCSVAGTESATPTEQEPALVEIWLSPDHVAYEAQSAWGLPLPCDLEVVDVPLADLQSMFGGPSEGQRWGHTPYDGCEIFVAQELFAPEQDSIREMVMSHELGHRLEYARGVRGHLEVDKGCPLNGPGKHLMCAGGSEALSPYPDSDDYSLLLGER